MPKKKIAVAMSEWVLIKLDEAAEESGVSRSMMVEEAVAEYVARRRTERNKKKHQRQVMQAIEDMREMAAEFDADPRNANAPSSLEILRAIRDGRDIEW